MLEELFGNQSTVSSAASESSLVELSGAIVADKVGPRQFKAAVKTPTGWLICEGGQLRGAVKRLRDLAKEKGYNLSLDVLSKADYSVRFGPSQGPAVQTAPAPEINAVQGPKSERSPVAPHVPTIRPPAFVPAPVSAHVTVQAQKPAHVTVKPAHVTVQAQKPALGLFAQLEKPAQGPAQGGKNGRKWTPGRRLETCYHWAAALSDAAKRVGASADGQRAAYKVAYISAFKAGCADGDAYKAEKFSAQVSAEFTLDQIRAEIERAGVPLAKLIAE
jgi:hypothetical protein